MAESQYVSNILKNSFDTAAQAINVTINNSFDTAAQAIRITGGSTTAPIIIAATETDTVSNALVNIDYVHHEIHEGHHYTRTVTGTAAAAAFFNVTLKKGLSTYAKRHMEFEVSANQAGTVFLYEMVKTSGAGGTTVTLLNNDRNSTRTSPYRVVTGKTTFSSSTGTLLLAGGYGANSGAQRFGGSLQSRNEWILKSTKEYLLRYDPDANTTGIRVTVSWYEHN